MIFFVVGKDSRGVPLKLSFVRLKCIQTENVDFEIAARNSSVLFVRLCN